MGKLINNQMSKYAQSITGSRYGVRNFSECPRTESPRKSYGSNDRRPPETTRSFGEGVGGDRRWPSTTSRNFREIVGRQSEAASGSVGESGRSDGRWKEKIESGLGQWQAKTAGTYVKVYTRVQFPWSIHILEKN